MKRRKMTRKVLEQKRGITLIALIVTIVVLIILALIGIQAIFGDNGLIKMAEASKKVEENGEISDKEQVNAFFSDLGYADTENEGTYGLSISEAHTTENITIDVSIDEPEERNDI